MRRIAPLLFLPVFLSSGYPATLTVDPNGGGDHGDIQSAIDAAEDGDTVLVEPGEYRTPLPITFQGKAIIVRAAGGAGQTILRLAEEPWEPSFACVVAFHRKETSASMLIGFTVTGGRGMKTSPSERSGGGIACFNGSSPIIQGCVIEGNSADRGGGVYVSSGSTAWLLDCIIRRNSALSGGGILSEGLVDMRRTVLSGNFAADLGGGMACFNGAAVENSLFCGNVAAGGGGIIAQWLILRCQHCTFHGNRATQYGGGIANSYDNQARIGNCLFWENEAPLGRAIAVWDAFGTGGTSIYSCLVEGGHAGVEVEAGNSPEWGGRNLQEAPLLAAPGHWDDGGTPDEPSDDTWVDGDYHLLEGSPAIDAGGQEYALEEDIELHQRPCGESVDIGAYEFCLQPGARFRRGDVDGSGTLDLADVIVALYYQFKGGAEPDCLDAADVDDDGELTLTDAIRSIGYQFAGELEKVPGPPGPFHCGPDVEEDDLSPCGYPPEICD